MGTNYCLQNTRGAYLLRTLGSVCAVFRRVCFQTSQITSGFQETASTGRRPKCISMQSDWAAANRDKGTRDVAMADSRRVARSVFNQGHVLIPDAALSVKSNPFPVDDKQLWLARRAGWRVMEGSAARSDAQWPCSCVLGYSSNQDLKNVPLFGSDKAPSDWFFSWKLVLAGRSSPSFRCDFEETNQRLHLIHT